MNDKNKLIRIYSGTELTGNLLQSELEKIGISCIIRNDFNSAITAGFSVGFSSAIDLLIQEFDLKKAEPIVTEFNENNRA